MLCLALCPHNPRCLFSRVIFCLCGEDSVNVWEEACCYCGSYLCSMIQDSRTGWKLDGQGDAVSPSVSRQLVVNFFWVITSFQTSDAWSSKRDLGRLALLSGRVTLLNHKKNVSQCNCLQIGMMWSHDWLSSQLQEGSIINYFVIKQLNSLPTLFSKYL